MVWETAGSASRLPSPPHERVSLPRPRGGSPPRTRFEGRPSIGISLHRREREGVGLDIYSIFYKARPLEFTFPLPYLTRLSPSPLPFTLLSSLPQDICICERSDQDGSNQTARVEAINIEHTHTHTHTYTHIHAHTSAAATALLVSSRTCTLAAAIAPQFLASIIVCCHTRIAARQNKIGDRFRGIGFDPISSISVSPAVVARTPFAIDRASYASPTCREAAAALSKSQPSLLQPLLHSKRTRSEATLIRSNFDDAACGGR